MMNIDQAMTSPDGWKAKKSKPRYAQNPDDQAPEFSSEWSKAKPSRSLPNPSTVARNMEPGANYEEDEEQSSSEQNSDKSDDAGPPSIKGEKWKTWKDSPYLVSNMGRVQRNGKLLKPRANPAGFLYLHASYSGKLEQPAVHRMVLETFGSKPPKGVKNPVVSHKDNNRKNNKLSNLRWSSTSDNTEDAYDDALYDEKGANNSEWRKKNGSKGEKKADQSHKH